MNQENNRFEKDIRLVPRWAYVLALIIFAAFQVVFISVFQRESNPPPFPLQLLIAAPLGSLLAFFIVMIVYVNRDARRRRMNVILWTLLVIFIPNAIGFILYFLLRKPVPAQCPQCGALAKPDFNFCPACKYSLRPTCPDCQHAMHPGDKFCPYCSRELTADRTLGKA
jgi:RNA polymerase subunit RPABC4/transcription elongation factor Spt4